MVVVVVVVLVVVMVVVRVVVGVDTDGGVKSDGSGDEEAIPPKPHCFYLWITKRS